MAIKLSKSEIEQLKRDFLAVGALDNAPGEEYEIIQWIQQKITPLKIKPEADKSKNLFFRVTEKNSDISKRGNNPVLLSAHLDSVQPCLGKKPQFDSQSKIFSSNGKTVLGADDLAGVVTILTAIFYLKKHKISHPPLEILFTAMEEIGGEGIKNFNFSALESKEGLMIDSVMPIGSIVMQSPSKYNLSLLFKGISSHGKNSPQALSAIKMMADLIHALPIGQVNKNTILNIGKIEGGNAINSVPGEAIVDGTLKIFSEGEIRSNSESGCQKAIDFILKEVRRVEKKYPRGNVNFSHHLVRSGYSFSSEDSLVQKTKQAMRTTGLKPKEVVSYGVSDANILNTMGYKTILIGTGVENAHTVNETIKLADMVKLTEIIVNFCRI